MSQPPDFLPIEDKVEWNLNAGVYAKAIGDEMRQLIARIKQQNDLLKTYNLMVHRAMDERKVVLSQTQSLHTQLIFCRQREFQMRNHLHQIGMMTLSAAQSGFPADGSSGTTGPIGENHNPDLILSIHFGADTGPAGSIRYSELRRVVKKDKFGVESESVACPNCDAAFVDRKGGKECGLREHLTKFKCPKLKHLQPDAEPQKRKDESDVLEETEKKKKKKKQQQQPKASDSRDQNCSAKVTGNQLKTAASIENELDDLEVHVSTPAVSPCSMSNLIRVLNPDE